MSIKNNQNWFRKLFLLPYRWPICLHGARGPGQYFIPGLQYQLIYQHLSITYLYIPLIYQYQLIYLYFWNIASFHNKSQILTETLQIITYSFSRIESNFIL